MAQYSNAKVLSAVINKWAQPVIQSFAGSKLSGIPFIQTIETKIKSTGWVGANWSLTKELSPLIEPITGNLVTPMLNKYISQIPDDNIPTVAHGIVDKAIADGQLSLFDGKVEFELADLQELKKLLDWNLPLKEEDVYQVITEEPTAKTEEPAIKTEEE